MLGVEGLWVQINAFQEIITSSSNRENPPSHNDISHTERNYSVLPSGHGNGHGTPKLKFPEAVQLGLSLSRRLQARSRWLLLTYEARGVAHGREVHCWGVSMHLGAWRFLGAAE